MFARYGFNIITTAVILFAMPAHAKDDNQRMLDYIDKEIRDIHAQDLKQYQKLCKAHKNAAARTLQEAAQGSTACAIYESMLTNIRERITKGKH